MRFPTMWYVRSAKPQISLRMRAVWSEPLLVAWVFYDFKLLTEHHLEFLSLIGGCRGSSKSTHVNIPYCWKSQELAQIINKLHPWHQPTHCHSATVLAVLLTTSDQNSKYIFSLSDEWVSQIYSVAKKKHLTLCMLAKFHAFLSSVGFFMIFFKSTFKKKTSRGTIRVSNSLDQDQDRHCVGPDLSRNCLQRLSGDFKSSH